MAMPVELVHTPNYHQIKQNFLEELTNASQGKPSSLSFIKHHLSPKPLLTQGIVQGIVIGGTNYILSTEEVKPDGTREIIERKTGVLPTFDSKETLVAFLAEHLDQKADAIGVNFGFPLQTIESYGEIDARLLYGTKEHTFTGLHEPIGQLIKTIFKNKYTKEPKVSIANDTICLTLAGNGSEKGSLVAGTGFNMGLVLQEEQKKILVNLEAGNFNKFDQSPILKKIDAESESPGVHIIEKTVSGKYLALYFNEKIKELKLTIPPITTSQQLSELSHETHTDVAGKLARAIITRSAYLVAAAIAGVYEFCIASHQMQRDAAFEIIGEGSLLWDGWQYHEHITSKLKDLGAEAIIIKHIKDSSINGAIHLITK